MTKWLVILGVVVCLFLLLPAAAGEQRDSVASGAIPATASRVDGATAYPICAGHIELCGS